MPPRSVAGFSGSQNGMTDAQKIVVKRELEFVTEFHHGDCVGADSEVHDIARQSRWCWIEAHPTNIEGKRAFTSADFVHAVKPPIERNHDIVDVSKRLIATPGEMHEVLRSGTWATIRYAVRVGIPVLIVYPDGTEEKR